MTWPWSREATTPRMVHQVGKLCFMGKHRCGTAVHRKMWEETLDCYVFFDESVHGARTEHFRHAAHTDAVKEKVIAK